ncbi:MAG: AAA family ATPase [Armatimonadota bacterium]
MSIQGKQGPVDIVDELEILIRARYPVIYVVTWEESRVDKAIIAIAAKRDKKVFTWSVCRGIVPYGTSPQSTKNIDERTRDPLNALDQVLGWVDPAIFVFKDFHPFLNDPSVVRKVRETAQYLKDSYKTLVLVSPMLRLPPELDKDITVIDFGLPGRDEITELLDKTTSEVNKNAGLNIELAQDTKESIVNAALGLTISEAENVFAKTLVKTGGISQKDIPIILSEKEQIIRKSGMLDYYQSTDGLDNVGGMDDIKEWLRKRKTAFGTEARKFGLPSPKGVLLIGVQGCGKSLCAKALASHWGVPLLKLDLGRVFSSLVGSSEDNIRQAVRVAESVAPAILWIDEVEKAFAGTQSSSFSDAGTTSRVFGSFITWLQEKTAPVFVIATANNISQLPPELLRKGRFDEIFFIDLPNRVERVEIFRIHIDKRGRKSETFDLEKLADASEGFSGAEIEESIIAALFDVFDNGKDLDTDAVLGSIQATVPLSQTMKEGMEEIREWAKDRARPATSTESVKSVSGRRLEL